MSINLYALSHEVIALCREVGDFIASEQHKLTQTDIGNKGLHDYVTYVDKNSEKKLVDGLSGLLQGSGFLVEEGTIALANEPYIWIIDPLDGTTNFIHKLPVFAISIALQKDGVTILGVVLDVRAGECFYAWQGGAAFLNDEEIHVSETSALAESLLATGFPYNDFKRLDAYLRLFRHLMQNSSGIRRYGSAAIDLSWVACGRFDGFWEYSLKPWDVAAGAFILEQAGGRCSDFGGGSNFIHGQEIVCGNPFIFDELLGLARRFLRS